MRRLSCATSGPTPVATGAFTMATDTSSSSGGIVDRIRGASLGTKLVVLGALLFVVPEPITSVPGALLVLAGVVVWAVR